MAKEPKTLLRGEENPGDIAQNGEGSSERRTKGSLRKAPRGDRGSGGATEPGFRNHP